MNANRRIVMLASLLLAFTESSPDWQAADSYREALASLVPEVPSIPGIAVDWGSQSEALWQQHKQKVSYCIGDRVSAASRLRAPLVSRLTLVVILQQTPAHQLLHAVKLALSFTEHAYSLTGFVYAVVAVYTCVSCSCLMQSSF